MPEIARICLASIRKHSNGHNVTILTEDNYSRFVNISSSTKSLYESGKIKPAHFADLIRINLLAQRGGVWLDATILLTAPLPEVWFNQISIPLKLLILADSFQDAGGPYLL